MTSKSIKTDPVTDNSPQQPLLMWSLLKSFIWLDRALQHNMSQRGWPSLSRSESQIVLLASAGIRRPTEISKALGLSRQAINQTMKLLTEKGLIDLAEDPEDRRCKIVVFATGEGEDMRRDALQILSLLNQEIDRRQGEKTVARMQDAIGPDWGAIPTFD